MTRPSCYGTISGQKPEQTLSTRGVMMWTASPAEDIAYMRVALDEARSSAAAGEVPIGAVIVVEGSILSRGRNQREQWQDPTAHAEMIALRAAAVELQSWRVLDRICYLTMEPCPLCIGAAILARLQAPLSGLPDPNGGAGGSMVNIPP